MSLIYYLTIGKGFIAKRPHSLRPFIKKFYSFIQVNYPGLMDIQRAHYIRDNIR